MTIEDNVLTVKGRFPGPATRSDGSRFYMYEFMPGEFARSVQLGDAVDADTAQTTLEHGVLKVTFEKVPHRRARQIKVEPAGALAAAQA